MEQRRLQLILDETTDTILKDIRAKKDLTYTATIKKAVKILDHHLDAQQQGYSIQVVDAKGKVIQTLPIL